MAGWQFGQTFQNKNIYIFECQWANGNSNDLCMAKLPFDHSHSNANRNWGYRMHVCLFRFVSITRPYISCKGGFKFHLGDSYMKIG